MTFHPRLADTTGRLVRWPASACPSYISSRCLHASRSLRGNAPESLPVIRTTKPTEIPKPLSNEPPVWRDVFSFDNKKKQLLPRPQKAHLLPVMADKSAPKIHILGQDDRSKYLAHVLSGLHTSIELLSWKDTPRTRYRNVMKQVESGGKKEIVVEENRANLESTSAKASGEPITQLIVTGAGVEAVPALEAVKDRVTNKTTVCLMSDGLGVLEDVQKRVFTDFGTRPNFLLGHMNHRLGYNRNHQAIRLLKPGTIRITDETNIRFGKPRKWVPKTGTRQPMPFTDHLLSYFQNTEINAEFTEYDRWLRYKLPGLIWDSVVEPVCVLLNIRYAGLLQNPGARHLMRDLLTEITHLLQKLPEVAHSPILQAYLDEARLMKVLHTSIITQRDRPSKLAMQVSRGLPMDLDYLHGYFIRRAHALGVDMHASVWTRTVIKAQHSVQMEKRNSDVAFEEISIPPGEDMFKYRTTPGTKLGE